MSALLGVERATVHTRGCSDSRCARTYQLDPGDAVFVCNRCERRVGYCMGAADDMPGLCDDCFCIVEQPPASTEEKRDE